MQIIDEHGRLFRKIHLLDLGVVGVIVAIGYGCLIGYWILSGRMRHGPIEGRLPTSLVIELMLQNLDPSTVRFIQPGDIQRDHEGAEVATVLAVDAPVPDTMQIAFGRQVINLHRPAKQKLPVLVKIYGETQGEAYFFDNRMIGVGETLTLSMGTYNATGVILKSFPADDIKLESEPWYWKRFVIELLITDVAPVIMKAMMVGDAVVDEQGVVAARILGIKSIVAGATQPSGSHLSTVRLLVEVRCLQTATVCESQPLGSIDFGRTLRLNFPGYQLAGQIVDFQNVK